MSIKTRLLLSYLAMTVIPVILFALIASTLASVFLIGAAGTAGGKGAPAFWAADNQRSQLIAAVKFMAQADPDRFTDTRFLQNTEAQLQPLHTALVVEKDNRVTYASPDLNTADLVQRLESAPADQARPGWRGRGGQKVDQAGLAFSDHSTGTVYLLSDLTPFINGLNTFFPLLVLSLLLVVGLTNGLLTLLVSRSLIKPLRALKLAAEHIKNGDLRHAVNLNRKDEIGELGAAFEEMRGRLNESISLQLQYEENRKELVSNISHDLKTPIAGIKACLEGIRDGIADTVPKREKYMGMIAKKTEEMNRLIDELLLFSKLDLKRLPFHLEPVDLAAYLRDCTEELRADPRMAGVALSFNVSGGGPPEVMADREKLRRVIMNIVDNSLKYMDKATPEITLELSVGPSEATVTLADNGAGIEAAALPQIFDRFYRAEPSRNKATGGSGLGLAIVKQLIEGQGGRVWAESRIGEGTRIRFTLPKTRQGGGQA